MLDTLLQIAFIFALFPIIILLSLLFEGVDRKLHARLQNRIGPPIIQPFYDFFKLFGKERIVPENASASIFTIAPIFAVICAVLGALIPVIATLFRLDLVGDLILVIYLLAMPSLMMMIGGSASGNPFATIGFSRAITMLMSYEVPFILSIGLIFFKTELSVTTLSIIVAQETVGMPLVFSYVSMALAAATFLMCIPIAAGTLPFDLSEAKTEISHGSLVEYSGPYLALMKMSKSILAFALCFLAATLFFNLPAISSDPILGPLSDFALNLMVTSILMFVTVTLPRTMFARAKPKQTLKFYWTVPLITVIIATIFNIVGF